MKPYRNLSGNSGVRRYEIGADSIRVEFAGGATYLYDYANTGHKEVEIMKKLAMAGEGLSTFISQRVGDHYAAKLG
jgi:hypothetical protein